MAYKYKVQAGDTLNTISSRFGFANYKEAGVTSVPSGNFDLIRPGDEIDIGNYDPSAVKPIGTTPAVISSNDVAGEYKAQSSALDEKLQANNRAYTLADGSKVYFSGTVTPAELAAQKGEIPKTGAVPIKETPQAKTEAEVAAQNPLYQEKLKNDAANKANVDVWGLAQNEKINALLPQTLALLDSQYANSVSNITNTYTKLIEEQKIINTRSIDRTKAYGLSSGAQYVPLEFSSAISEKETKAANEIASLENTRNDFLARARAARDQGKITSLRENMDALNKVEETMRTRTKDLADEVQKRYELTVAARKETENKQKEAVQKMLAGVSINYLSDFKNAKDNKAKNDLVQKIILDSAGVLSDADYYSVYTALNSAVTAGTDKALATKKKETDAVTAGTDKALATKKKETDIESTKALTADRISSAAKNYADIAVKSGDKKNEATMKAELDSINFTAGADGKVDKTDATKKRQEFVKKYGKAGKEYWDSVFKDDAGFYDYQKGGGTLKSPDGVSEVNISDLTSEQLKEAKAAGWK